MVHQCVKWLACWWRGSSFCVCGFGARSRVQCFKWVPPGGGDRGAGGGSAVHWCGSAVYGRTDSDDEPSNEWEPVVVVCVRTTACACTSYWPLNNKCALTVTHTPGHYSLPIARHIWVQVQSTPIGSHGQRLHYGFTTILLSKTLTTRVVTCQICYGCINL